MAREESTDERVVHHELSSNFHDPLIRVCHVAIRICIKMLAVLMVLVIFLGVLARKVIVLDLTETPSEYVFAIGVVTLALGVTYWLVSGLSKSGQPAERVTLPRSPSVTD